MILPPTRVMKTWNFLFLGGVLYHTLLATGGELCPTLEDVVVSTDLPLFREGRAIKRPEDTVEVFLDGEGKRKLEL